MNRLVVFTFHYRTCLADAATKPAKCQKGKVQWEQISGKGPYFLVIQNTKRSFTDVRKECQQLGGDLASIHSKEENNWLTAKIKK